MNQIKHLALELAGRFYDQKRSDRFRSKDSLTRVKYFERDPRTKLQVEKVKVLPFFEAFPDARRFALGHYPLFIKAARTCLVAMLRMPDARISQHMKEAIAQALIEDRNREYKTRGRTLIQGSLDAA